VEDKARIERHLTVTSRPAQAGAFHWINDREVHWRPASYWKPGTTVTVKADVGGVPAGNGIYGQLDREMTFTIGRAQVVKVNAASHRMQVFRGGRMINDFPITTGKPGHTTRSGTKVIMEKFPSRRMNSETVGIPVDSSDGYDLDNVKWAMRLTYSGEFIHAAPWSVGSQGSANVSHGCTGMSTANAKWLYDNTLIGDPIEYSGTDRPMTLTNGYGDWNLGFEDYRAGSALAG
jgi:lipoprotein-anchoring transpeptidase ErfK/SrfK